MRDAWIIVLLQGILLTTQISPAVDAGYSDRRTDSESAYVSYVTAQFPRWNLLGPDRNDQSVTPTESGSRRMLPILSSLLPVSERQSLYGDMGGSFFFTVPSLVCVMAEIRLKEGLLPFHPLAPMRFEAVREKWRRWITIDPLFHNTAIPIDQWQYMDGYLHLPEFTGRYRSY